ncbi:glycosyltransferase involved in cell wall biosynthesis [Mucilaginibacter yixingensis]|uniref:Glycosyltransferase involved in cell wall biosynthesis n=1 Tax=Mucilaginibacter yixingensis TaxID=1295612 RepID=A0A2T5JC61_9SPHI|nr:glycosyltransferase [Mucilaginibacter yixingensis]PTQ99353.1 glycosyltransferase involved in cell wall biosynthesis [Mucilaginibacter yixingensis]
MKIIFICASAEPGRDGVGDYSRRLAAALICLGHEAGILAINDHAVDEVTNANQSADGIDIKTLRIPASLSTNERLWFAKKYIGEAAPDWLSLQYVPFGFHPKGLKRGLGNELKSISGNIRWHVMFHELWVGMAEEESAKLIWWGKAQQYLIRGLLKKLDPKAVHTQTMLYQAQLKKLGVKAGYLPLFGNIPVTGEKLELRTDITFVLFGAIHSGGLIDAFAAEAARYASETGMTLQLLFVGRCGEEQYQWAQKWQAAGLQAEVLGEQSTEKISALLSSATAGISTTGLAVVEKSGAFAAMRNHGLPVISLSKPWTPFGVSEQPMPQGIVKYNGSNFNACLEQSIRYMPNANQVQQVAAQLIAGLPAQK